MAIQITIELEELRRQAEGAKPFVRRPLFDKLAECVCTKAYWAMTPQQRLCLGYYLCAARRAEMLRPEVGDASS